MPHIAAGRIKPLVDHAYPFDQLPAARDAMESNRHTGKVVITL
jgi:NADPH:quinone reductase-like Zn-dependent oxidoreductase